MPPFVRLHLARLLLGSPTVVGCQSAPATDVRPAPPEGAAAPRAELADTPVKAA